jgi:5'-nucleotidase
VKSIHLAIRPKREDADSEDPADLVRFAEQEDGTVVEIKQRKVELGEEVRNVAGGRVYRVVSSNDGCGEFPS